MKEFILDRIENGLYLLETEDGKIIDISKNLIKTEVNEGDVLIKKEDGYYLDKEKTENRREYVKQMMEGMWNE